MRISTHEQFSLTAYIRLQVSKETPKPIYRNDTHLLLWRWVIKHLKSFYDAD
jgi:hypothetical protein